MCFHRLPTGGQKYQVASVHRVPAGYEHRPSGATPCRDTLSTTRCRSRTRPAGRSTSSTPSTATPSTGRWSRALPGMCRTPCRPVYEQHVREHRARPPAGGQCYQVAVRTTCRKATASTRPRASLRVRRPMTSATRCAFPASVAPVREQHVRCAGDSHTPGHGMPDRVSHRHRLESVETEQCVGCGGEWQGAWYRPGRDSLLQGPGRSSTVLGLRCGQPDGAGTFDQCPARGCARRSGCPRSTRQ